MCYRYTVSVVFAAPIKVDKSIQFINKELAVRNIKRGKNKGIARVYDRSMIPSCPQ